MFWNQGRGAVKVECIWWICSVLVQHVQMNARRNHFPLQVRFLLSVPSLFVYEKGTRIEWNSVFGFAPTDAVNLHRNHPKLGLCSGSLASLNLSIHVCRNWFLFVFCSSRVYISSLTNMMPCCWWIHKHPFPTLTVSDWETTSPLQPQDQVVCFTLFPDLWDFIWLFIYFGMRLW